MATRVRHQRQHELAGPQRDRGAAEEVDGEHGSRELADLALGVIVAGQVQRGSDRRRVDRIGDPDRDHERDQPEHGGIVPGPKDLRHPAGAPPTMVAEAPYGVTGGR
jgi:hypothetical protein